MQTLNPSAVYSLWQWDLEFVKMKSGKSTLDRCLEESLKHFPAGRNSIGGSIANDVALNWCANAREREFSVWQAAVDKLERGSLTRDVYDQQASEHAKVVRKLTARSNSDQIEGRMKAFPDWVDRERNEAWNENRKAWDQCFLELKEEKITRDQYQERYMRLKGAIDKVAQLPKTELKTYQQNMADKLAVWEAKASAKVQGNWKATFASLQKEVITPAEYEQQAVFYRKQLQEILGTNWKQKEELKRIASEFQVSLGSKQLRQKSDKTSNTPSPKWINYTMPSVDQEGVQQQYFGNLRQTAAMKTAPEGTRAHIAAAKKVEAGKIRAAEVKKAAERKRLAVEEAAAASTAFEMTWKAQVPPWEALVKHVRKGRLSKEEYRTSSGQHQAKLQDAAKSKSQHSRVQDLVFALEEQVGPLLATGVNDADWMTGLDAWRTDVTKVSLSKTEFHEICAKHEAKLLKAAKTDYQREQVQSLKRMYEAKVLPRCCDSLPNTSSAGLTDRRTSSSDIRPREQLPQPAPTKRPAPVEPSRQDVRPGRRNTSLARQLPTNSGPNVFVGSQSSVESTRLAKPSASAPPNALSVGGQRSPHTIKGSTSPTAKRKALPSQPDPTRYRADRLPQRWQSNTILPTGLTADAATGTTPQVPLSKKAATSPSAARRTPPSSVTHPPCPACSSRDHAPNDCIYE